MKKKLNVRSLLAISLSLSVIFAGVSCDKENQDQAPELPPVESLVMDFSDFSQQPGGKKSTSASYFNFFHSYFSVLFWSGVTTVYIVPPIIVYSYSLQQTPVYLGDNTWEWAYSAGWGNDSILVSLTGARINNEEFSMEMNIASAETPEVEVKWFDGIVRYDHTHAEWNFYKNGSVKMIEAEWNKDFETEEADLTYTYTEEGNAEDGSYIKLAHAPTEVYDASYTISLAEGVTSIEWNTTTKEGRVMDEGKFGDTEWHCWDSHANGLVDKTCSE